MLIAYDCDLNFEPCAKNGLKSHWALLTGFYVPIDKNLYEKIDTNNSRSTDTNGNPMSLNMLNILSSFFTENTANFRNNIYTLCRHGKTQHVGLWNLNKLIESNRQLREINHKACPDNDFVKPLDGNIQRTLSSKILVFI